MRKIFTISLFLIFYFSAHSQKYEVTGTLTDTSGLPLIAATVMLMDADSVLLEYTLTDNKGEFEFKSIREPKIIIKATYIGYIPKTIALSYENKAIVNLGKITMAEMDIQLMEVVIKEAKAPLRLRGDTVEYDISQFKVPEGATLEELLKRLPGLELSQDGAIQSDGKDVTKLTVDGKTFFSDDPKFAIKNLPAEGVSKVQVFDKKDEEALLTGKSTSSEEKTMNVELKEEFKKGGFGKATVGGGSISRGELKANYNKFDKTNQISFVGIANNTGRNGLSWDDYQDFMGSNSWEDDSDYNYGFGNGFTRYFGGSGSSDLENKVSNAFFSGNSGGFPTNIISGINYNHDKEKNKFSGRYLFQNTGNEKETFTDTRTFLSDFNLDNARYNNDSRGSINHRAETKYQYDFDSLLTAIATADVAIVNTSNEQNGSNTLLKNSQTLTSSSMFNNSSDLAGRLLNTSFLLRKKFKKAGRSIGFNVSYLKTDIQDDQQRFSDNFFYNEGGSLDSSLIIKQFNKDTLDKYVVKSNVMYSEPLNKNFFLKVFYNYGLRQENGTRITEDQQENIEVLVRNNLLSRIYDNKIINQRAGTSLTYSHKNNNVTIGGAYQTFDLVGNFRSPDPSVLNGKANNQFYRWLPYAEYSGNITRNTNINVDYEISVSEPTIDNLLPVVDFSNPLYITEGNPDLVPTLNHRVGMWFNHSWPAEGIRANLSARYTYYEDQIITEQLVDQNLVTRSKPVNYDGGTQFWSNAGVSFPIIRNKLKMRTNVNFSSSNSFAFVNNVLNTTVNERWSPSINFDFTPNDKTAVYLNSSISFSSAEYDINTSQNQNIVNQNYNLDVNHDFGKGWFVNSTLRYSVFENDRFGISQNIPIINFSVYKQIFKGKKGEIRLSLFDALNKSILINQSTSVSRVFDSRTPTLARYVMLSFSYNLKGMKTSVAKNNHW
ncbi:MAG: outer membrane beta-barrel protein [Saprospiraceae bacterium]|nr:outer membrane beta-barrel protein [Saprospiraceae bacterium]